VRIAVIGAGVTGLVAGLRLVEAGHECDVYERWPGLGGQAATFDAGDVRLERYYHVLFRSDGHMRDLHDEVGLGDALEWHRSSVAVFRKGRLFPFTTPAELLRFSPLSPRSRVRVGLATMALQRRNDPEPYHDVRARDWVERNMGRDAYAELWGPLLESKFGPAAGDISMAWLWSKLVLRRRIAGGEEVQDELLGYPRDSWEPLFQRLAERIEAGGGRVLIDRPVARVGRAGPWFTVRAGAPSSYRAGLDPGDFALRPGVERYDRVLATVPSDLFHRMLEPDLAADLDPHFRAGVGSAHYTAALCLLLELDRPLTPYYWTNVCDDSTPFIGLVEHTNLVGSERYGGRRFLYVANYLPLGHPFLAMDEERLLARYTPGLQRVNPGFSRAWVRGLWRFAEPAAQPVVTVGYRTRMPALRTGVPGLVLANTTQVYPEDRGTNYAVRLAADALEALELRAPLRAAA
jgi:protoporphyrinogen oxidase